MTVNQEYNEEKLEEEELEEETQETKEKTSEEILTQNFQRLQADFENFRKRTIKEKENLRSVAAKGIIEDMLPVLDNLHRALNAGEQKGDLENFIEGVQMIRGQFWDVLQKHGLEYIDCVGNEFNPEIHQAVMQRETPDQEDNLVLDEVQKGYLLNGKLIRPSMVCVSKKD